MGLAHNVLNVLVLLGIPLSVIGILGLPWQARDRALHTVVLIGALAFLVTGLLFPVATTWGTFLHAAAPVHVLVIVSALGALDAGLARLGRRMRWRPADLVAGCHAGRGRLRAVRRRPGADHRGPGKGHRPHLRCAGAPDGDDRRAPQQRPTP